MGLSRKIYNLEERKVEALRLLALGNSVVTVCSLIGVSGFAFYSWMKKDDRFKLSVDKVRNSSEKMLLRNGVGILASGHDEVTEETEWIDVDDEGRPIKRKRKVKHNPPNVIALKMLANKHDKDYNEKVYNDTSSISIRITQQDRSLSIEERLKLLESDASGVIECNDYKELEDLVDIDPP